MVKKHCLNLMKIKKRFRKNITYKTLQLEHTPALVVAKTQHIYSFK